MFRDVLRAAESTAVDGGDILELVEERALLRNEPGDLSASFHSRTDLTASVYSVGLAEITGMVRLAL